MIDSKLIHQGEVEVSIIIPAYNAEDYVERCVNSCLEQTFESYEVVVVDDGSSDNTYSILERLSKQNDSLKIIHHCCPVKVPDDYYKV